jgi:RNA polymerase sigma-70 factor (ECF subfamily)
VGDAGVDWEVTYREHVSWVYAFVNRRVGNRSDAEDLTSEVFLRALPRLRLGAAPEQLRAYLAATARSLLAEHWQRHYDLELPPDIDGGGDDDDSSADDERGVAQVHRLLEKLPDHYRRILELRFLRGYSIREAAGEMRVSIGNAKVLQHRALRRAADLGEGWNP